MDGLEYDDAPEDGGGVATGSGEFSAGCRGEDGARGGEDMMEDKGVGNDGDEFGAEKEKGAYMYICQIKMCVCVCMCFFCVVPCMICFKVVFKRVIIRTSMSMKHHCDKSKFVWSIFFLSVLFLLDTDVCARTIGPI